MKHYLEKCHLEYNIYCFGDERPPGKNATWKKYHLEYNISLGMKDHLKNILTGIPHCLWIQCHFERELALQLLIMRFHADQYIDRIIVYMQIYDIR